MRERYDVAVIGGGTAGVVAAIQAARAGADTLLVEKTGMLGGTLTVAQVANPGLFDAWGVQIIAGIGWELVTRAAALTDAALPDMSDPTAPPWGRCVKLNPSVYAAVADQAVLEAGVDLHLHTMPAAAADAEDGWRLTLCAKTGLVEAAAAVVIDATGDANVVSLAGLPIHKDPRLQPGTIVLRADGYDIDALDLAAIDAAFEKAVEAGEVKWSDVGARNFNASGFLSRRGGNTTHVPVREGHTSEGRTAVEVEGRAVLLRLLRFFRRQPGLEAVTLIAAAETGVRESVGIVGAETITTDDYLSGRLWTDAVCYSFWPIDIHTDGEDDWVDLRRLQPGTFPTIPRGAMLPAGSRNLIVPGRAMSGDRAARSAFRIQATCMAAGQAAGAMAALAAAEGVEVLQVPIDTIRATLAAHGAILPGDVKWPPSA